MAESLNSFTAQLVHDVSKSTSSIMKSIVSPNSNMDDEKESKQSKHKASKSDTNIIRDIMLSAIIDENMFKRLMHPDHRNAAKIWSQLCHKIDISYPSKKLLSPIHMTNKTNTELINEIRYSMRHSFTAYHPAFVAMASEQVSLVLKTTKSLLKTCFNISDDDIIIDNCSLNINNCMSSKTHEPSFYLIIDHNEKKIVLSIRGTSSMADVITDLNAVSKQCDKHLFGINGCVHEGMLEAAHFIRKKISLQLINLCEFYPTYNCIITGHSLGAGVASLLGLMYKDHPTIYQKNGLKVYSFASPCIVSKQFVNENVGNEYITSIALSTDIVTRLSKESIRKCNLRHDFIMKHSKEMITECMTCENSENECLGMLKYLESSQPNKELFPLGRVLWFVPNVVMNDDIIFRRNCLMNLNVLKEEKLDENNKDENKSKLNEIFVSTWGNMTNGMKDFKQSIMNLDTFDGRIGSSASDLFKEFYYDLSKGVNDIKTDAKYKLDKSKKNKKYLSQNYILCDASECKYIFQELVFDLPESFNAHQPQRYLWACDTTLRLQ